MIFSVGAAMGGNARQQWGESLTGGARCQDVVVVLAGAKRPAEVIADLDPIDQTIWTERILVVGQGERVDKKHCRGVEPRPRAQRRLDGCGNLR